MSVPWLLAAPPARAAETAASAPAPDPYPTRGTLRPLVLPRGTIEASFVHKMEPGLQAWNYGLLAILALPELRLGIADGVEIGGPLLPGIFFGSRHLSIGVSVGWGFAGSGSALWIWLVPDVLARWRLVSTRTLAVLFSVRLSYTLNVAAPRYAGLDPPSAYIVLEPRIVWSPFDALSLSVYGSTGQSVLRGRDPSDAGLGFGAEVQYTFLRAMDVFVSVRAEGFWRFPWVSGTFGFRFRSDLW